MANILDYNDDEISQNKNPKKYKKGIKTLLEINNV